MPCVEETEKASEMPRGLLPPHPWLLTSLHFLLSRTSKAESLAIVSAPPSPFPWRGLNYSRLQRLNKPFAEPVAEPRRGSARPRSTRRGSCPHAPALPCARCPPGGLRRPPRVLIAPSRAEPSRAACPLREEVVPSPTQMRGVMGGGGRKGERR